MKKFLKLLATLVGGFFLLIAGIVIPHALGLGPVASAPFVIAGGIGFFVAVAFLALEAFRLIRFEL